MSHIVFVIPKLYFDPPMSPHKKKILELANAILTALRVPPNYLYHTDGSKLYRYTTDNTVHSLVLQLYLMVDTPMFKDALTYLEIDGHISISNEVLTLLPKGRIFCGVEGGYDYGQNEPIPEFEFILKDGLLVPKPKEDTPVIRYQSKLQPNHKTTLIRFLKKHNLVNDPKKFVEFLNGENDGEGLTINEQDENLTAVTLLLKELRKRNLIELTTGNEFQQYFASHIRPFSVYKGKEQVEKFKKEIRKATNKKWKDCPIAKELEKTIETFILAGITVFVISL